MEIIGQTLHGFEEILSEEIAEAGGTEIIPSLRAVSFIGDQSILYKLNYTSRIGLRFLLPILRFTARNEDDLYRKVKSFNWKEYLSLDQTFAIKSSVHSEYFNHSKYVALKTKDAIVDQFRDRTGKRPNIDPISPDIMLHIHIQQSDCQISLDSSGDPLFKRGYRQKNHKAPLNEILAAGMIRLSEWDERTPFHNPMCGSGTILMEASMKCSNIPAGYFRKRYGFQNWADYDESLLETIISEADSEIVDNHIPLSGSDINRFSITHAQNIFDGHPVSRPVINKIKFQAEDKPHEEGLMIINPPYGERLDQDNIMQLYEEMGDTLKKKYSGWTAWIISSNMDGIKKIGLRPSRKITLFNGSLECKYLKFQMYAGSKRTKFQQKSD